MKTKLSMLLIFLLCFNLIFSQSRQDVLQSFQNLANKASGEKIKSNDVFSKKDDKLGKQIITEKEIIINTIPGGKGDYQNILRYTEIPWNSFFDFIIYTDEGKSGLKKVRLNFKKNLKIEQFSNDEGGGKARTIDQAEIFILSNDKAEVEKLLSRLYDLIEKRTESQFNNEIRKFTREKTIDWLIEKLKNNIAGDQHTRSLNIVSIDACNLVFDYSNMVGRKYRETIPTNISAINKYNKFTYDKKISISKSYAFGIIQKEDETTYQDESFIGIRTDDKDLILNVEFAMKHLSSFCKDNSSSVTQEKAVEKKFTVPEVFGGGKILTATDIEKFFYPAYLSREYDLSCLSDMENKSLDTSYFEMLDKKVKDGTQWTKKVKTNNTIEGISFTSTNESITNAEIFYNQSKKFCYYNKVVSEDERLAAIEELITKQYIRKKEKDGSKNTEKWTKKDSPYEVRLQYDDGAKGASIALINIEFLKKFK